MNNCKYEELNQSGILKVIQKESQCIFCVAECDQPYAVPMFYEVDDKCRNLVVKLKSFDYGMKTHCISNNNKVCITVMVECKNTIKSVILFGNAEMCENCCSNSIEILVSITEMTGREYYK